MKVILSAVYVELFVNFLIKKKRKEKKNKNKNKEKKEKM
jgi:hypothetical protein